LVFKFDRPADADGGGGLQQDAGDGMLIVLAYLIGVPMGVWRLTCVLAGAAVFVIGCLIAYIAVAAVTFGAIAWKRTRNRPVG
jgi:hypothetical protein